MYDINEIMEQLRQGRTLEEIGNDFATALNAAKATLEAEEAKRQKEKELELEHSLKVGELSDLIYSAIGFIDDYYPKLVTALFPNSEYNTDEMAEHLVHAMDEAYAEVFEGKKSSFTRQFEDLVTLFGENATDLDEIFNSTRDIKIDDKYTKNEELKPPVNQYKGNKKADDSDDDGFAAVLRMFLNE